MPRARTAPKFTRSALDEIRDLRQRIEHTKGDLREQRAAAAATIAEIDQALAELGDTPTPIVSPPPRAQAGGDARPV